jgi:hypothetical protein
VNNPESRNPTTTSQVNPVPEIPVVPEPPQPETQQQPETSNSGGASSAGAQGVEVPAQAGKEVKEAPPPELSQYITQPPHPVAPATVVPAQRSEHVERAIAKMMAEEKARRAAENKSNKPQMQASVEFPKEYLTPGPQQKVSPAGPKMAVEAAPGAGQAAVTFNLSPKPIKQKLGETFAVAIEVGGQTQMSGARLALKYDATKLQVKSVKDDGLFGAQPEFSYDISAKGVLSVSVRQGQNQATARSGRLVTIEFTAIGAGQSEIAFNRDDTKVRVGSAQIPAGGSSTQVTISRD